MVNPFISYFPVPQKTKERLFLFVFVVVFFNNKNMMVLLAHGHLCLDDNYSFVLLADIHGV